MKTFNHGQGNRTIKAVASGILLGASFLFSTSLWAQGISGTAHDFSDNTDFNTTGEICKVCHTPHNANIGGDNGPLWNRTSLTSATYTLYSGTAVGSELNHTITGTSVSGVSKLCLSCHDGTIALDAFGGATGTATKGIGTLYPTRNIGGGTVGGTTADLSNDHPVSFNVTSAAVTADTKLNSFNGTAHTIGTTALPLFAAGAENDRLECATCHDVHDDAGNNFLLRMPQTVADAGTPSGLCLNCHNK